MRSGLSSPENPRRFLNVEVRPLHGSPGFHDVVRSLFCGFRHDVSEKNACERDRDEHPRLVSGEDNDERGDRDEDACEAGSNLNGCVFRRFFGHIHSSCEPVVQWYFMDRKGLKYPS